MLIVIAHNMKYITSLLGLFLTLFQIHAAEIKALILPGAVFGKGWELSQPNIIESSALPKGLKSAAAPNYLNRSQTNQPVVMVNIMSFPSAQAAKERLQQKFGTAEAKQHVKKLSDEPETYEQTYEAHRKRFILIHNYWLTVEQIGDRDDRTIFIEKYTQYLKKHTKG